MATIVRSTDAHPDPVHARYASRTPMLTPLVAGEILDRAAPCYIKSSDGKIYMCNAGSSNEPSEILGFTGKPYVADEPVTLFREGSVFYYSDGNLTAGDKMYLHTASGLLSGSATLGDALGVAVCLDTKHILVTRAHPTV